MPGPAPGPSVSAIVHVQLRMEAGNVIEAQGLTKRYGDKLAVDDLSFTVRPGRVTGFLGPNGAGKSTTMRLILGLDAPTRGSATVNGKPYRRHAAPLQEVGALLGDPRTVILDEPLNGLDTEGIRWVRSLLLGLAAEGRTVFVSSHLMNEMALTAQHLIVIGRGRLIADTGVADFVARAGGGVVRVRSTDPQALAARLRSPEVAVSPDGDGALTVSGSAPTRSAASPGRPGSPCSS
jgi:ABC-2 type transport system ATP-binding protein